MSVVFVHTNLKKQKAMFWPQKISYDTLLSGCHLTLLVYVIPCYYFIRSKFLSWRVPHNLKNWVHFGQKCLDWFLTRFMFNDFWRLCKCLQKPNVSKRCLGCHFSFSIFWITLYFVSLCTSNRNKHATMMIGMNFLLDIFGTAKKKFFRMMNYQ